MKIRMGFVSNSSSSSYIVKVGMKYDDFMELIYREYSYLFFNEKKLKKEIDTRIENIKESIRGNTKGNGEGITQGSMTNITRNNRSEIDVRSGENGMRLHYVYIKEEW